ncbi:mitochondrial protein C2orf69-like [Lytechinus pictus]|uniref:mitochondrial protein C2orf69-like n=1 Tax=Lytechinus pictus TaxID=7653 RepID=UPI0030B9B1FB
MRFSVCFAPSFHKLRSCLFTKLHSATFSCCIHRMACGELNVAKGNGVEVLEKVEGFEDRRNTLLFGARKSGVEGSYIPQRTVVFFPGDVQNFENIMKHHEANQKWKEWTFESNVRMLQHRFPDAQVVMVTPSRRVDETFSCYGNFMETDVLGSPTSYEYRHAWEHLRLLIQNARKCITEKPSAEGVDPAGEKVTESSLTVIGFSKGCTVLNQLMYELESACSDQAILAFIRRVEAFYWLDGGHAGTVSTYVTDDSVLRAVANLKATFNVHVTPYQVKDEGRPHIGEDHLQFISKLMSYGADVKSTLHFRDESRSLKRHFEVLKLF